MPIPAHPEAAAAAPELALLEAREEGLEEGRQAGLELGREEGRVLAAQALLRKRAPCSPSPCPVPT